MFFQASVSRLWRSTLFLISFSLQLGCLKSPPQQRLPLCGPKRGGCAVLNWLSWTVPLSPSLRTEQGPVFLLLPPPLLQSLASQESIHLPVPCTSANASVNDLHRLPLDVPADPWGRISSTPAKELILTDSKQSPPRKVKVAMCTKRHNPTLWRAKPALGSTAGNPPLA